MFKDLRQSGKYSNYINLLGWGVDKFEGVYIYIKKFLFWKFVKIQRPSKFVGNELLSYLVEKYRCSTVYAEPNSNAQYDEFIRLGFKKYNSPFLPSKTIQIDLTKSEDQLLREMHYKTRYNIIHCLMLKAKSLKFKTMTSDDIEKFAEFWQKCARDRGMFISQKNEIKAIFKAFGSNAIIHVVELKNTPGACEVLSRCGENWLAALLRISTNEISYYMYAAATSEGKKIFAPTILAWEAIRSAKKEGNKIFDFEGIYDERFPLKSWKGFSRFKKSFGGEEIEYPGTLCKIVI